MDINAQRKVQFRGGISPWERDSKLGVAESLYKKMISEMFEKEEPTEKKEVKKNVSLKEFLIKNGAL